MTSPRDGSPGVPAVRNFATENAKSAMATPVSDARKRPVCDVRRPTWNASLEARNRLVNDEFEVLDQEFEEGCRRFQEAC
jgi:hypothetical protein